MESTDLLSIVDSKENNLDENEISLINVPKDNAVDDNEGEKAENNEEDISANLTKTTTDNCDQVDLKGMIISKIKTMIF